METVLVATDAILALLDADSPLHRQALAALSELRDRGAVPLLTNFTVAETFTGLAATLGPDAGRTWLRHNIWEVERVSEADEERAREIVLGPENSGRGPVDVSYAGATAMAVMERLGIKKVFSFDPELREAGLFQGNRK